MDALAGIEISTVKVFDQIVEVRAEKREHLRGRNNVTSCRSPTRGLDTRQIKNELKEKRQLEFLRRRSVSPEECGLSTRKKKSPKTFSVKYHSSSSKVNTSHTNIKTSPTANGHPKMLLTPGSCKTDSPSTSTWVNEINLSGVIFYQIHVSSVLLQREYNTCSLSSLLSFLQASLWPEQATLMKQEKGHSMKQASTSTTVIKELDQRRIRREKSSSNGESLVSCVIV